MNHVLSKSRSFYAIAVVLGSHLMGCVATNEVATTETKTEVMDDHETTVQLGDGHSLFISYQCPALSSNRPPTIVFSDAKTRFECADGQTTIPAGTNRAGAEYTRIFSQNSDTYGRASVQIRWHQCNDGEKFPNLFYVDTNAEFAPNLEGCTAAPAAETETSEPPAE